MKGLDIRKIIVYQTNDGKVVISDAIVIWAESSPTSVSEVVNCGV